MRLWIIFFLMKLYGNSKEKDVYIWLSLGNDSEIGAGTWSTANQVQTYVWCGAVDEDKQSTWSTITGTLARKKKWCNSHVQNREDCTTGIFLLDLFNFFKKKYQVIPKRSEKKWEIWSLVSDVITKSNLFANRNITMLCLLNILTEDNKSVSPCPLT